MDTNIPDPDVDTSMPGVTDEENSGDSTGASENGNNSRSRRRY
jgi:hypothetical protein